jgi:hypothetical protein
MFATLLAAAAATVAAAQPAKPPSAAPTQLGLPVTPQTEITVILPIGVLEAAKQALHKAYTGAEADPVIELISKQEQAAVAKLQPAAKVDKKP